MIRVCAFYPVSGSWKHSNDIGSFPGTWFLMAWIILKEKLTAGQIIGLLLSITGMVLMGGTITGIEQEKFLPWDSVCTDLCLWLGERGNHMWVWYEEWCDQ